MAKNNTFTKKAKTKVPVSKELLQQLESMSISKARDILDLLEEIGLPLENLTLDDSVKTDFNEQDLRVDILQTNKSPDSFTVVVSKLYEDNWEEIERHNSFDSVEQAEVKFNEILESF
jgi:hypothetical protein